MAKEIKTRINFWYEGELDQKLTYYATEEELKKELEKIRAKINSEDYEFDVSDIEFYEQELDKKFKQVEDEVEEFDYNY